MSTEDVTVRAYVLCVQCSSSRHAILKVSSCLEYQVVENKNFESEQGVTHSYPSPPNGHKDFLNRKGWSASVLQVGVERHLHWHDAVLFGITDYYLCPFKHGYYTVLCVIIGILWSLWSSAFAVWDFSESGCEGYWGQNCPPPGCSERFCCMCGGAAKTSGLLHSEGAQTQVDSSPCCRCVQEDILLHLI